MKRFLITFSLFMVILSMFAQSEYCTAYDNETIIRKTHLTISWNNKYKVPNYVGYCLTKDITVGYASRDVEKTFYDEPLLPKDIRSHTENYTNSGYDRGHMAPAADWKYSQTAMHESFTMANIAPQCPNLNRHYWVEVEEIERYIAHLCDTAYVITGCIIDEKRYIERYISNGIVIPREFYKAIIGVHNGEVVVSEAYIYKNIDTKQTVEECLVTIKNIEQRIGKNLFARFWFNDTFEDLTINSKNITISNSKTAKCQASTAKGTRCQRNATNGNYCWQHAPK